MENRRSAYGPIASRLAASFEEDEPVILFDGFGTASALADAVERRFRGERFFVRALLQDEPSARIDAVSTSIFDTFASFDDRSAALVQAQLGVLAVGGGTLANVAIYLPDALRMLRAIVRLADGVLTTSESERRRIERLAGPFAEVRMAAHDLVVPVEATGQKGRPATIVVWADGASADAASLYALELAELKTPVTVVCSSGLRGDLNAAWCRPEESAGYLARAKVIVDTTWTGADAAARLASWNRPLVFNAEGGGQEFVTRTSTYSRSSPGSLFSAVARSIGTQAGHLRHVAYCEPPSSTFLEGPLVSVIIPTFDRPRMLRDALTSIRMQQYRNVETIVVIDGGPRIDDVAADFSEMRFIHMEANDGIASMNTAFNACRGAYVAFLNDDDLFMPNHISELAGALERSGENVAHSDVLTAFLRGDDSSWELYGFESNLSNTAVPSAFLVTNQIGMTSCMVRRSAIENGILMYPTVPYFLDYALWLRLALQHTFVHVERMTSCYTIRNSGSNQQSVAWADQTTRAFELLYQQFPLENRPRIEQKRQEMLARSRSGNAGPKTTPAFEIPGRPWPPWAAAR